MKCEVKWIKFIWQFLKTFVWHRLEVATLCVIVDASLVQLWEGVGFWTVRKIQWNIWNEFVKSLSEIKFSGIKIEPAWDLGGAILPISGVLFTNFLLKCGSSALRNFRRGGGQSLFYFNKALNLNCQRALIEMNRLSACKVRGDHSDRRCEDRDNDRWIH